MPLTLAVKISEDWGTETRYKFLLLGGGTMGPIRLITVAWLTNGQPSVTDTLKKSVLNRAALKHEIVKNSFPKNRAGPGLTHRSGCLGRGHKSCNILWADVCRSQYHISLRSAEGKKTKQLIAVDIQSQLKRDNYWKSAHIPPIYSTYL